MKSTFTIEEFKTNKIAIVFPRGDMTEVEEFLLLCDKAGYKLGRTEKPSYLWKTCKTLKSSVSFAVGYGSGSNNFEWNMDAGEFYEDHGWTVKPYTEFDVFQKKMEDLSLIQRFLLM